MKLPDLERVKLFYEENERKVKMAAVLTAVGLSMLFFWINGNRAEIEVLNGGATGTDMEYEGSATDVLESITDPEELYVDISGEVRNQGVYKVRAGTRLFEVIEMAGGMTENADPDSLNRAEAVYDGEKIIVRGYGEGNAETYYSETGGTTETGGKININTADLESLTLLPGIGETKGKAIISYREKNGRFQSIDDLKNVSGIGDGTFEVLKDLITV